MKQIYALILFLLPSLVFAYQPNIKSKIVLKNGHEYQIEIDDHSPSHLIKMEYSHWILGEKIEKRMLQNSINNLCQRSGTYLNPKTTICTSSLTEKTSCFSFCDQEEWTPPWDIISTCDDCDKTDIVSDASIRGKVLLNKKSRSPIIRFPGKVSTQDMPALKRLVSKQICSDEYGMNKGSALICGETYDIEYGSCNSTYQFHSQCLAYCF